MSRERHDAEKGGGTSRRRVDWKIGDVFLVPAAADTYAVGQIIGREASVLNSVTVALFDRRMRSREPPCEPLRDTEVFAALFVTRDLLDRGAWPVVDHQEIQVPRSAFPHEDRRSSGFVGARVIGSGIVQHFVAAFFGLEAWNQYKDPLYFDKLLLSPEKKPTPLPNQTQP